MAPPQQDGELLFYLLCGAGRHLYVIVMKTVPQTMKRNPPAALMDRFRALFSIRIGAIHDQAPRTLQNQRLREARALRHGVEALMQVPVQPPTAAKQIMVARQFGDPVRYHVHKHPNHENWRRRIQALMGEELGRKARQQLEFAYLGRPTEAYQTPEATARGLPLALVGAYLE